MNLIRAVLIVTFCSPYAALCQTAEGGGVKPVEMAPQPVPAEARALGHHGKVQIRGSLSQGKIITSSVLLSSGSPILDKTAISTAQAETFQTSAGPVSGRAITLEVDFENYRYDTLGSYSCGQINLDTNWLLSQGVTLRQTDFYSLITGFSLVNAKLKFMRGQNAEAIWRRALDQCRTVPDSPFLPVLLAAAKKGA